MEKNPELLLLKLKLYLSKGESIEVLNRAVDVKQISQPVSVAGVYDVLGPANQSHGIIEGQKLESAKPKIEVLGSRNVESSDGVKAGDYPVTGQVIEKKQ